MGDITKDFSREEFACPCCGFDEINEATVLVWQAVRDKFGAVTITSGCRCPKHNKAVGGSENSQHLLGNAADGVASGASPKEVADFIRDVFPSSLGVGEYGTFVHVDSRMDKPYRWNG